MQKKRIRTVKLFEYFCLADRLCFHLGQSCCYQERHECKVKDSSTYFVCSLNYHDKLFPFAGSSALHYAAQWGSIKTVQKIFDRVQSPNWLTHWQEKTPLCFACEHNSPNVGKQKLCNIYLFCIFVVRRKRRRSTERRGTKKFRFNLFSDIFSRKRSRCQSW